MITREQYMAKEATHDEYYGQFATDMVVMAVSRYLGPGPIMASNDAHFNDIPLETWNSLSQTIKPLCVKKVQRATGGAITQEEVVCIAKAAARKIKEGNHAVL